MRWAIECPRGAASYLNGFEVVVDGGVMLKTRTRRILVDARRLPAAVVRRS